MKRCAAPPNDMKPINAIEVSFAIPVYLTDMDYRAIDYAIHEIVRAPYNEPVDGVHWPAGSGSKPKFSRMDSAFLGKPADLDAPDSGEPTFDDSVYFIETSAREFVSDKERERIMARRGKPAKARPPSPFPTWLDAAVSSFPNTNLSIPENCTFEQAECGSRDELKALRERAKDGMEARDFLRRCSSGEYRIVSSGDLTTHQIAEAQSKGLFYVDPANSLGWALLPWELTTDKDEQRAGLKA